MGEKWMRRLTVLVAFLLSAGLLGATPTPRTLLVFPFENLSGRADLNWISESFAETLTVRLESSDRVALGRQERNAAYVEAGLPAGVPITLASSYRVAKILGADWAIVGDFDVLDDALRLRGHLLDVANLRLGPRIEIAGTLDDLVELQTLLAWRLLRAHDARLPGESEDAFQSRFPEERLDAYENYIRGVIATETEARVRHLTEADRLNPSDRRAAMELGRHYFVEEDYENSAHWLRKIRPQDSSYHEALFLLGINEYSLGRADQAEKALRELVREVPLSEAWNNLGAVEARRGRYTEAVEAFEQALAGDPADPEFAFNLAVCLDQLKRFEEAEHHFQEAARLNMEDPHRYLGLGEALKRRKSAGVAPAHTANTPSPGSEEPRLNLRLKRNYDGRAFRLLSLAAQRAQEAKLGRQPDSPDAPPPSNRIPGRAPEEGQKP
jgi:Flp pilus assembly protein TadD/TolB-like protein